MKAGALRHKVSIQEPVETQNTFGEAEVRWQNIATGIWAGIEPLRGREYFAAKQITAEIDVRITIRYRNDVTAKMKIVNGADEYLIDTLINVNEQNRELQLMCTRFID